MKKIGFAVLVVALLAVLVFYGFEGEAVELPAEYIRIHIRANSDSPADQAVKERVRDAVIGLLTPLLSEAVDYDGAKKILAKNLSLIEQTAGCVLADNGHSYTAAARITTEEFPLRSYGGFVLESGLYEALIIDLGRGEGANWWCVAFPPLCFVPTGGENIVYRSKILEIINNFRGK